MRLLLFLVTCALRELSAQPVAVVDLSGPTQNFPTNRVSVSGCHAAYDSSEKEPPARCMPFPVTLEIQGERSDISHDGSAVLEILVTNTSSQAIQLPSSPKETTGGGQETFISLEIYSPPGSLKVTSLSYAFTDTKTGSSVVILGPHESVLYDLPFDKKTFQKLGKNNETEKIQIEVRLNAYSVQRGPKSSDDVSAQRGNPIVSKPFTLSN